MISVLVIWSFILLTVTAAGSLAAHLAGRIAGYKPKDLLGLLLTGTVCVTVYAQIWSVFGGVGSYAVLCMCVILAAGVLILRDQVIRMFRELTGFGRCNTSVWIIVTAVLLIFAYGASHGVMHYDTGLYHAQAIHWIEEYGSVPGLANLHTRLGYNSSAFVLNALYSFGFLGQSFHATAGFCALLLAWECAVTPVIRRASLLSASNMARLAGIYYLLMIFDEMVSPASDYYMVTLGFILIIRWLDAAEDASRTSMESAVDILPRLCMLSLLGCFIITIKLSGALFALLALLPALLIIRSRKFRILLACTSAGAFIILPYLIRNLILSGWLLYPSTALGFFDASWRVPYDTAVYDYREIQVYGRGYTDVSRYGERITKWFFTWFMSQSSTDRILIAAAVVGCVYFVVKCVLKIVKRQSDTGAVYTLYAEAVLCACFIFWLFTSPLMRYGCLYVYLCDAVIWGGLIAELAKRRLVIRRMAYIGIVLFLAYKSVMFAGENIRSYRSDTWIMQQDYDRFETEAYEIDYLLGGGSDTFYAPVSGDRTGYEPFPSSPWRMDGYIAPRGDSIDDGFMAIP